MFVRNCLTAGNYLTLVPNGIPLTLQYSPSGLLERAQVRERLTTYDVSSEVFSLLRVLPTVPRSIPAKQSTTTVRGVLYCKDFSTVSGIVPEDTDRFMLDNFVKKSDEFEFLAGDVTSLSNSVKGAVSIRQWLTFAKFTLLPGFVIPANLTESTFLQLFNSQSAEFDVADLMEYIIITRVESFVHTLGFRQARVLTCKEYVSDVGELRSSVSTDINVSIDCPYSDTVRMNIQRNVIVTLDENCKPIRTRYANSSVKFLSVSEKLGGKITCPVCGKLYPVSYHGAVSCPDSHCASHMYKRVLQALSVFKLPTVSRDTFDLILSKQPDLQSVSFVDVFTASANSEDIVCTLSQVLRAIVPYSIVSGSTVFDALCNACNNTVSTLSYYLVHPDKIENDLHVSTYGVDYSRFLAWLSDSINVKDIQSVLDLTNVHIEQEGNSIVNAPQIFRGVTITITGDFIHGNTDKIRSILSSYGADVLTTYSNLTSFVVTGSTASNISGNILRTARGDSKPIYDELSFFKQFEIDRDLAENLK